MGEPLVVEMPLGLMLEIRDALRECGEDLECEVNARYPEKDRATYPSYQRKWDNEMGPVRRAEFLIQAIYSQPWYDTSMERDDG